MMPFLHIQEPGLRILFLPMGAGKIFVYWFGDIDTTAVGTSGPEEAGFDLLTVPSRSPEFTYSGNKQ